MSEPWAELGETISAIRTQLQQAMNEGACKPLAFRTGPVELEFSVVVRKEGEAKAKVFVLPWTGELRAAMSSDAVHRIKLTLPPIDATTTADAHISGEAREQPL